MPVETEKKYALTEEQRAAVLDSLKNIGAVFVREDLEENIIFTGGALNDKNAVLRLRRIGAKTIMAYKERLPSGSGVKHQLEHETEVGDFAAALKIIEALGLTRALVYEKVRGIWRLGDAEIVLDKLPFGHYMEIEGSIDAIEKTEKLLQIEDLETVHETYPQLTAKLGRQNGRIIEARFEP
jgi:adenylate cyclase class 2